MKNYKEIKRTNNGLPKFNTGTVPSLNLSGLNNLQGINISNGYYHSAPALDGAFKDPKNGQLGQIKPITQNAGSGGANWSNGGQIVQGAVQFAGATINSFGNNQSSQDVLNNSGQQQKQAMGVAYDYQMNPDENKEWSNLRKQNTSNALATTGVGAGLGGAIGTAIAPGIGSLIGAGIGGLVGLATGLFGASSRAHKLRKAINNARLTAEARNTYNYAGAASQGMQNEYYQENGDTDNGILYANKGKDLPKYNNGKDSLPFIKVNKNTKVWSPEDSAGRFANAMVGLGESLIDFKNKNATLVTKGKGVGIDDQYAYVNEDTFIPGNDRSWKDGKTFAEKAQPDTLAVMDLNKGLKATQKNIDKSSLAVSTIKYMEKKKDNHMNNLQAVADEQKGQHEYEQKYNTMMANRGRDLMRCDDGLDDISAWKELYYSQNITNNPDLQPSTKYTYTKTPKTPKIPKTEKATKDYLVNPWSQWTAHLPAALGGLGQIIDSGQESHVPRIYRANPYGQFALNMLAKNRPDPYNQIRAIDNSERQALYSLRGVNNNLRSQSGIAAILGAGANRAGIYSDTNDKMNQYRTALANLASTQGQQDRVAGMEASKYMEQALRDTAAAKYKMKNTGWQNINNAIEQSYADNFKLNMAQKQLGLYNQELSAKQQELINNYNIAMANIAAMKGDSKTRDYITL